MNASDRLQEFIQGIQNYIEGKNLGPTKFNKDYRIAETYSTEKLEKLTQDECFNGAFLLYQYADYINSEKASQELVFNWCDKALNTIISTEIEDLPKYTRHEIKVAHILRSNDLAQKISDWKSVAEGRITALGNKEYSVRKKADCLIEKGRRK